MDRTGAAPIGLALWGTEPVRTMADYAQLAEQVGFESIWLVDTQLLCRELYVTLAACAMATERLKLASGVTVPVTRHESVHGERAGNVAGAVRRTGAGRHLHWSLGVARHRRAACALLPTWPSTYVSAVRQLMAGESSVFASGSEGALTWLPEPASVPFHIAASGPRLTRAAAGMADGVILLQGAAPDLVDGAIDLVRQGAADAGRLESDVEKNSVGVRGTRTMIRNERMTR